MMWRQRRRLAILGFGVSCLLLSTCRASVDSTGDQEVVFEHLVSALDGYRTVEPRITGGFAHAPCRSGSPAEGCSALPVPGTTAAKAIARAYERLSGAAAISPQAQHEQARGHLLAGSGPRALTTALDQLKQRVDQEPTVAVLSDLAAAQYVRARREDRPADLVRALALAERATQQAPTFLEAHFNRALILESLFLHHAARIAWQQYRQLDPESGWSDEAALHLARLDPAFAFESRWEEARSALPTALTSSREELARIVGQFPLAAREYLEQELLPRWATAARNRRPEAGDLWRGAQNLAAELAARTGDGLWAETLAIAGEDDTQALAAACLSYATGLERYRAFDLQTAARHLRQAQVILAELGSPLKAWCDFYLAVCLFQRHDQAAALDILNRLAQEAEIKNYGSLRGRALWVAGLSHFFLGRPLETLHDYRASRVAFKATSENELLASIHSRLADILRLLGQRELAWQLRYQALGGLAELRSPQRRHFILGEATLAALALDEPLAARVFQQEALRQAQQSGTEVEISEALRVLAAVHLRAGEPEAALLRLQQAKAIAEQLIEPSLKQILTAKMYELEGRLHLPRDPQRAVLAFNEARTLFQGVHYQAQLAETHLERAIAYQNLGDVKRATEDLEAALGAVEDEWQNTLAGRERGADEELWPAYFDDRQSVFDRLLLLLVDQGRIVRGFEYAEKARARDLLDLASYLPGEAEALRRAPSSLPRTASQIIGQLPPGVAMAEYALGRERLFAWILWDGEISLVEAPVGRGQIEDWVEDLKIKIEERRSASDLEEPLARLYRLLIAPVLEQARGAERLVVIPDEALHEVPYAALLNPVSGRYLIEEVAIALAPSATLFIHALERDRALYGQQAQPLIIADPALDRRIFPTLPPLPGAAAEAEALAKIYPQATVLTGSRATKSALLQQAGKSTVVHVATHTLINRQEPFLSALILAPSSVEESGALYAHELLQQSFSKTRLMVLSGCSTAGGHRIGALGVSGLMRPVLGAGIPGVLGSLWPVHDRAAARLLTRFHHHYAAGDDAARALQRAQLDLLQGPERALRPVWMWSPFVILGHSTPPAAQPVDPDF